MLAIVAFAGCATTAKFEAKLQNWIGYSEDALLQAWGPPSSVYRMDSGGKMLPFDSRGSVRLPTHETTSLIGNTAHTNVYGGQTVNVWYSTTFTISPEGQVVHWRWQGNSCR